VRCTVPFGMLFTGQPYVGLPRSGLAVGVFHLTKTRLTEYSPRSHIGTSLRARGRLLKIVPNSNDTNVKFC